MIDRFKKEIPFYKMSKGHSVFFGNYFTKLGLPVKSTMNQNIYCTFQSLLKELGKLVWNPGQVRVLVKKAMEALGPIKDWTVDILKDLGRVVEGLLPSELNEIKDSVIKQALEFFKDAELDIDQVFYMLDIWIASTEVFPDHFY